jgi:hypothetical protein
MLHRAQSARRSTGVLQTYSHQLTFQLNRHVIPRIRDCSVEDLDRVGPTE